MEEINQFGLYPKDVRLMKNKETGKIFFFEFMFEIAAVIFSFHYLFIGQSRGFAFIEFVSIEQATQLKELTQVIYIHITNPIDIDIDIY